MSSSSKKNSPPPYESSCPSSSSPPHYGAVPVTNTTPPANPRVTYVYEEAPGCCSHFCSTLFFIGLTLSGLFFFFHIPFTSPMSACSLEPVASFPSRLAFSSTDVNQIHVKLIRTVNSNIEVMVDPSLDNEVIIIQDMLASQRIFKENLFQKTHGDSGKIEISYGSESIFPFCSSIQLNLKIHLSPNSRLEEIHFLEGENLRLTLDDLKDVVKSYHIRLNNSIINAANIRGDNINLRTTNANILLRDIKTQSLTASTINAHVECSNIQTVSTRIESSNQSISGDFVADESLVLSTSNGSIDATAYANDVTMTTSNSSIRANLYPNDHSIVQDYKANLSTSNAKIDLRLCDTFEGNFRLSTSNAKAEILTSANIDRNRLDFQKGSNSSHLMGSKGYGNDILEATTSNASLKVQFKRC